MGHYIVLSLRVAITILFCIVYFEAVAPGLNDVSNNRLKYADVSGTAAEKTSVKFTYPGQCPKNPPQFHYSLLLMLNSPKNSVSSWKLRLKANC